ncbi:MAG: hypothetical protein GF334_03625 [Candidatus Altiarchaeales archaeon]|nr:hypothetical protein [Candidatus Altiarchaeales archaeon]
MLDLPMLGRFFKNGQTTNESQHGMENIKDPFDYWNRNAFLEYQEDDVRIYDMEGHKYLFIGQVMYASTAERGWYIKNVMPYAKGKCLEIGLGLGVASKCILVKDEVRHLLTIEKNEKVVDAFGRPLRNHNILHMDVNDWLEGLMIVEPFYDFIFVDHYAFDEEDLEELPKLAEKLEKLLRPGGNMVFWIDENAEEEDKDLVRGLWKISK